jgi:hypothetical protein
VLVLEVDRLPPQIVIDKVVRDCGVAPERLTLVVTPTHSVAGTVQVVARVVEVALHKIHVLGEDLNEIVEGSGCAPLPPQAPDGIEAMGGTNDAILYGGRVYLSVNRAPSRTVPCRRTAIGERARLRPPFRRDLYVVQLRLLPDRFCAVCARRSVDQQPRKRRDLSRRARRCGLVASAMGRSRRAVLFREQHMIDAIASACVRIAVMTDETGWHTAGLHETGPFARVCEWLALISSKSTLTMVSAPSGVTSCSCSTRSRRACKVIGMSPISSRNSVPPFAWCADRTPA